MLFIIILASTLLLEVYVALIYGMLGFIQFDIIHFVVFRLLPTLIMNFVLLIMLYPLIIKFLKNKQWHWHETSSMVRCNSWVVISSYIQPLKYRFKNILMKKAIFPQSANAWLICRSYWKKAIVNQGVEGRNEKSLCL